MPVKPRSLVNGASDDDTYRVFGFVLNEEFLVQYALEHRLGTVEDQWQRAWAIGRAAEKLLRLHDVYPCLVAGVEVNGKVKTCAAIASEDAGDNMSMPPKETIEKLKGMFKTTKEPRWYLHI
ncbi:hypothetical protein C8R46DRAFT_1345071 [Mycena filopes]|nr:hypothetical protein C8R46DRAFT_1345071 [Mycena filopes]